MVKVLIITLVSAVFCSSSYALNARIVVLDSPLFEFENEDSKILQYLRKGESLFIKTNETETPYYKTITRSGKEAFVLKSHVLIDYKDKREFANKNIDYDETDYRLDEPLPKEYPLKTRTGYRGVLTFSTSRSSLTPYNYREDIIDSSVNLSSELSFVWLKLEPIKLERRFFFGAKINLYQVNEDYLLVSQKSTLKQSRFTVGPYASYDVYRKENIIINAGFSLQLSLYDRIDINIQEPSSGQSETRTYSSTFDISSELSITGIFLDSFLTLDTMIGLSMKNYLPREYQTTETADSNSFWQDTTENDLLDQPFSTEVSLILGVQTSY